ncbi:MAG: bifunctional 4-hydroxy-2-oxoglutarate aldolase/2-dehydro-3-deoxy-phosphogluconate aldolase [Xanthobacteraceae bacterium]|nr:bifunctional 4-hydroxy-2-oxoglutarate aldolase/2-dehydro-3-deoxy-phosphogluconate aldolase [Xanthobacteraceae bacterium]
MPFFDPTPLLTVPVVPVLTIERAGDAVPLARALLAGGLPVIEVTLRTPAALDAVRAIAAEVPDVILGAGTVTKPADATQAIEAGADFLVSPGTPAVLAEALRGAGVPAIPGCATVTEAMTLAAMDFPVLKFFPAEQSGGVRWLKAVAEPLSQIKFCPTGGINGDNAASYLALPNVIAVGGSWVAPPPAIAAGDFEGIAARARAAAALRT